MLVCVCLYFLMFYLRYGLMRDDTSLFRARSSKHTKTSWSVGGVKLVSRDCTCAPDHMNNTLIPGSASTKPVSVRCRYSVCSARWQPGLERQRHSRAITQSDLFPYFIPTFLSRFLSQYRERNTCSPPKADMLNISSLRLSAGCFFRGKVKSYLDSKGQYVLWQWFYSTLNILVVQIFAFNI